MPHVLYPIVNPLPVKDQALVDDSPPSHTSGTVQPLSMTPEGRLRVTTDAPIDLSPWSRDSSDAWGMTVGSVWAGDIRHPFFNL